MKKKSAINLPSKGLFNAIEDLNVSQVDALISDDNLAARDRDGRSPLMRGVIVGNYEVVRTLLRHGADVNAQDKAGWTALHFAAQGMRFIPSQELCGFTKLFWGDDSHTLHLRGDRYWRRFVVVSLARSARVKPDAYGVLVGLRNSQ
jgi:hypothetical protein